MSFLTFRSYTCGCANGSGKLVNMLVMSLGVREELAWVLRRSVFIDSYKIDACNWLRLA